MREELSRARILVRIGVDRIKGAAFTENSVIELIEVGVIVEVEVGEFPASIKVSRVITDKNWYTGSVLAASDEDVEKAIEEDIEEDVEEDIEEDVNEIKTVERIENNADVVIISTALLRNEAGIVALEERVLLITNDVEVLDDEYTAVIDKDRSSDDAVIVIVRTTVETLSVEAEAVVVDINIIDYIEVDASEVTPIDARDKEADIELNIKENVAAPLLIIFPIKIFISRSGLIVNIIFF
jgi:hypothetical protein